MSDVDDVATSQSKGWINRNIIGLGINRFLSDFGHEAGTAILPLFLTAIGAPPIALGAIEAVSDGLSSFAKLFGGWLGDRVERRRPWAAAGYALTGLTTGLYGLFSVWPWVLFVRAIGWAGRGLRSPLHDALLTDSVPAQARGRAFGLDEALDTLGAILGPVLALVIVASLISADGTIGAYRVAFWLAAIPGVLAALSILLLVKETPHPTLGKTTFIGSLRALPTPFRRYLAGIFVFGSGDFPTHS
jgi:MFS family permease